MHQLCAPFAKLVVGHQLLQLLLRQSCLRLEHDAMIVTSAALARVAGTLTLVVVLHFYCYKTHRFCALHTVNKQCKLLLLLLLLQYLQLLLLHCSSHRASLLLLSEQQ
jgi:hypothetical protein